MKRAAVDLNTECCQGQRGKESVNLTEIQLRQHSSLSPDSSICPVVTSALSPSITEYLAHSPLVQMLLLLAFLHDISPSLSVL